MKISILFLSVLFLTLFTANNYLKSQNDIPTRLSLDSDIKAEFKDYYGRGLNDLVIQELRILGFSLDGKIAYVLTNAAIADINTFPDIYGPLIYGIHPSLNGSVVIIQDLFTDEIIWAYYYGDNILIDGSENIHSGSIICVNSKSSKCRSNKLGKSKCLDKYLFTEESVNTPKTFIEFWNKSSQFIKQALDFYKIDYFNETQVYLFPINYKSDILNIELDLVKEPKVEFMVVKNTSVELISQQNGRKTIYNETYNKRSEVVDAKIIGCIKNPNKEQVAIILIEICNIAGEPGFMTHSQIIGATVTTSFN